MDTVAKINAYLFYKTEPTTLTELENVFHLTREPLEEALSSLRDQLSILGLSLVRTDERVAIGIAPEHGETIAQIRKEELAKELSKASLETLAIILYSGGVTRAKIDFIRGVNSSFILRNLLIRGLIEKTTDREDERKYLYKPSIALLAHLGVRELSLLPEFQRISETLKAGLKRASEAEHEGETNEKPQSDEK